MARVQIMHTKKATPFNLFKSIQLIMVLAVGSTPAFATDSIGNIVIDGEPVPPILFDSYRRFKRIVDRECLAPVTKDQTIDLIITGLQYDKEIGRSNNSDRSIIGDLQHALPSSIDGASNGLIKEGFSEISTYQRKYLEYVDFKITATDVYNEYKKRIRDKDPHITNLSIVRVREINAPGGREADKAMIEMATAIKEGMPFEEAATLYPPDQYETRYQEDKWVALHSLPLDINKDAVKVGDVYGVENVLSFNIIYKPMVKILELKTLSEVRDSDKIFVDRRPTRNPHYLHSYLYPKAKARKIHLLMSELWANHTITEDGKPLARTGLYRPCAP